MTRIGGHALFREAMSVLFEISHMQSELTVNQSTPVDNAASDDSESEEEVGNSNNHDWALVKNGPFNSIADQVDSYVECVMFCLVEPVHLGFFPFHTEDSVSQPA